MISTLGSGYYYQAKERAKYSAPVYGYLITQNWKHPFKKNLEYSWHTADLPLQMRIVQYKEYEKYSQYMSNAWAAFIRNGNPCVDGYEWKKFTKEAPWVMVIGDKIELKRDPQKEERSVLEKFSDGNVLNHVL